MKVKKISKIKYSKNYVFDLSLENNHNYFIGKAGVNVHNSGKSFVAKKTTVGHGFKMINSDSMFEKLMKDANMSLNMIDMTPEQLKKKDEIRDKAKKLTDKQKKKYVDGRIGLVIDGTGRNFGKIKKQKEELEKHGYDTYMVFVNTSLEVALERNAKRERSVPEDMVIDFWKAVQNNIGKFQNLFGNSNFTVVDNSATTSDKNIFSNVWKEVMKFAKKPARNKVAKQWIQTELSKKGDKGKDKK